MTMNLPETTMIGEPGPKFFPSMILVLMALFSILLFISKDKNVKKETSEEEEKTEQADPPFPISSAVKLFAVFFIGIILVYFLGFNIGMIIGLSAMLWLIGWRLFPRAVVFSAAVTLAVYFLFDWLLKIPLPTGILF
jgi:Ca2+/Na+ antiporter